MEDYEAINHKEKLISRQQIIRDPDAETKHLVQKLDKLQEYKTQENTSQATQEYNKQKHQTLHKKQHTPENQENAKQTSGSEKKQTEEQGKQNNN